MKRIVMIGAIVAAAALPATSTAGGSAKESASRGGEGLEITFTIRSVNGEATQIRRFRFKNFTVNCAEGGPVDVRGRIRRMKINDQGNFDGTLREAGGKIHVEGDVKGGGRRVKGTLKATGKFAPAEGCNTKVAWEAK